MAITVLGMNAPDDTSDPAYSAQVFRQALSSLVVGGVSGRPLGGQTGWVPGAEPAITINASTRVITIPACALILDVQTPVATGPYLAASDASDTSLTAAAAHATLNRKDIVAFQLSDDDVDASDELKGEWVYVQGTAASSPAVPDTPDRSFLAATITVPSVADGGSPAVTVNRQYSVASGGVLPVANATARDALITAPYKGMAVYMLDSGQLLIWDGTSWSLPGTSTWLEVGPTGTTDATTGSVVVSLDVPVVAGRRYKVSGSSEATKITAAGEARAQLKATVQSAALQQWRPILAVLAQNSTISGTGFGIYDAPATTTETFTLTSSASAGGLRNAANSAQIFVEDLGVTPS